MRFTVWFARKKIGEHEFERGSVRVGRHPQAEIFLPHRSISRLHCVFEHKDGEWAVCDPGGTNGVLLNGVPVQGSVALTDGALVELGKYTIHVSSEAVTADEIVELMDRTTRTRRASRLHVPQPTGAEHHDGTIRLSGRERLVEHLRNRAERGAHLNWTAPSGEHTVVVLTDKMITIGSAEDCRIMLGGLATGKLHASVQPDRGGWAIVPAAWWTVVKVNGTRVKEITTLEDGDHIEVAGTPIVFHAALFDE